MNLKTGIAASIGAALCFTIMDAFVKSLGHIGTGELTFFRGLIGLAFLPVLAHFSRIPVFSGKNRLLLLLRGLFGGSGIIFVFLSIQGLTLGDASILTQLSAFFMCILSPLFLKEQWPSHVLPGLIMITAGTFLVLQIWNYSAFNVYALYGLAGAVCSAAAYITIGLLGEKGGHSDIEIIFYFQLCSMLLGGILTASDFVLPSGIEWLWIGGMSFFALAAQMLLTWAYQHTHSLVVSFTMYTGVLFHVWFGWILWDETLTLYSEIGGVLILAGSAFLLLLKQKVSSRI
jgi:drug/metabolite transporter (DMT)-like permease